MATGRLWAPCAGPILGLILTGALGVAVRHMHDDLFGVGFRPQQFGIRRAVEEKAAL